MSEVLSQNEVDALLRGVSEGKVETETDQPEEVSGVVSCALRFIDKVHLCRILSSFLTPPNFLTKK